MTTIGRLKQRIPGSLTKFNGDIQTPEFRFYIRIEGDEDLCDDRKPSHVITGNPPSGGQQDVELGKAWLKTIKNGPNTGDKFLSISIDFPGNKSPLNVAAFRDPDTGDWSIVWRRRNVSQAAA